MDTRLRRVGLGTCLVALAAASCGGDAPMTATELPLTQNASENQALAAARAASAAYHDAAVAVADGFAPLSPCVSSPFGTMGFHYVNLGRLDGVVTPEQPEALLYVPKPGGGLALAGVEYMLPIVDSNGVPWTSQTPPPSSIVPSRPSLFGQPFDGPMAGHAPGEPWHFDLHVWAWRNNPDGMFSPWNPSLTCSP